jgi:mono/diheme cytochrome c family protein
VRDFHDPAFRARATSDAIVTVMMAGKGQMPAFGSSLSLPKMQALSGYVRRLGVADGPLGAAP